MDEKGTTMNDKVDKYLVNEELPKFPIKYMIELPKAAKEIEDTMNKWNDVYAKSKKAFKMLQQAKQLIRNATKQAKKDIVG